YESLVQTILRTAASRAGLGAMLDVAKGKPSSKKRASLRVGLAFNLKRIDSHSESDAEAEYDSPKTIESITRAIESWGHQVVQLEAVSDFPRTLMDANVDCV